MFPLLMNFSGVSGIIVFIYCVLSELIIALKPLLSIMLIISMYYFSPSKGAKEGHTSSIQCKLHIAVLILVK
jgi:hypothetical protein